MLFFPTGVCWGWCCFLTDCYTQWKCITESLMSLKALVKWKGGKEGVFLLPATVASYQNLPQPHYWLCWGKAMRTAWEQNSEIKEGKILPQGPGDPAQVGPAGVTGTPPLLGEGRLHTCAGRLSAAQRQRHSKHSATACIQQISTEHHQCLMRL